MDSPRLPRTFVLGKASAKPHSGRGFDATPMGGVERDAQPRGHGVDLLEQITGDHLPSSCRVRPQRSRLSRALYTWYANAHITNPVDLDQFISAVREVDSLFVQLARIPHA